MPTLVLQHGPEQGRVLELRAGLNTFGRAETNDFAIEDPSISAHHCVLSVNGEAVVVRDLDSTNGTFIDGESVHEGAYAAGQTLRLGDVELLWERAADTVSIPDFHPAPVLVENTLPEGTPVCAKHPGAEAVWQCNRCQRLFCNPCIHHLQRVGGPMHNFCPSCSGECHWIGPTQERKVGLFRTIQKAVTSIFRRR
jgi:hypothetical protein